MSVTWFDICCVLELHRTLPLRAVWWRGIRDSSRHSLNFPVTIPPPAPTPSTDFPLFTPFLGRTSYSFSLLSLPIIVNLLEVGCIHPFMTLLSSHPGLLIVKSNSLCILPTLTASSTMAVFILLFGTLLASGATLMAQLVKNSPAMRETWVQSLGWEDPLEKGKATHSSILAWRIPWTV